jgi:hypothetical protein
MEDFDSYLNNILIHSTENDSGISDNVKQLIVLGNILKKRCQHVVWNLLHAFSVSYPENPTENQKKNTKELLTRIKFDMPFCSSCGNQTTDNFVETADLETVVSNSDNLIQFLIDYHSFINTNIAKVKNYDSSIYTPESIKKKINDMDLINLLENKYEISFIKMISEENMPNLKNSLRNMGFIVTEEIKKMNWSIELKMNIK